MHCSRGGRGGWVGGGVEWMVGRRKRRRNERICVTLVCKSRHPARREHTCEIHDTVSCIQGDCVTRLTPSGCQSRLCQVFTVRIYTPASPALLRSENWKEKRRSHLPVSRGTAVCTSLVFETTHFHKRQSVLQWPDVGDEKKKKRKKKAEGNRCRAILSLSDENIGQGVRWLYSGQEEAAQISWLCARARACVPACVCACLRVWRHFLHFAVCSLIYSIKSLQISTPPPLPSAQNTDATEERVIK